MQLVDDMLEKPKGTEWKSESIEHHLSAVGMSWKMQLILPSDVPGECEGV